MFRNSGYDQSGIDYNDEYYAPNTTMDRVGRRMNRRFDGQNGPATSGYYNARQQGNYQYGRPRSDQYAGRTGYNSYNADANIHQQDAIHQQRNERVEQIVYNSATLSGNYYNLNDPKNDVRCFTEGMENEE